MLTLAGCEVGRAHDDASIGRDAALADGGGLLDGGGNDAGAMLDAGIDASAACEAVSCDPTSPDGCAVGESCVLHGALSSCEASAGSFGPGSPCVYVADCAPGLACFETRGGGICGRICCPGDDTCVEGASCGGSGILVDGTETSWGRCLPPRDCDVLRPEDDCEPREGCYIVDSAGNTECRVAGTGEAGAACSVQQDCSAGFFCGGIGATHCVRICRLDGAPCPDDEGRCVAQAHSPAGTGLCTIDASTARP